MGALVSPRLAHVSFDNGVLFIASGKGDRYVCIDAASLTDPHLPGRAPPLRPVAGPKTDQIEHIVREVGLRAGLVQKYEAMGRSFSPHSLRHAFATHRHDVGMDLFALQRLLGHLWCEFISTTLIYVETSMRLLRKQHRKTDPLHRK